MCKRVDHQGKISQKSSSGEPFLKPTGGECAGTAVCPNTTTLARGQQRPTDPGRMLGEDGHLLGVFLKCTWAQRGKRFRKTLGIDSFADPGRRPGENGHLLGVFLKCT